MLSPEAKWFAISVRRRFERIAAEGLRRKGLEVFLPMASERRVRADKLVVVEVPLFEGYLFSRFLLIHKMTVLTTPAVREIVGIGRTAMPVADSEIHNLQVAVRSALPAASTALMAGQRVRIVDGPLRDVVGHLVETKGRMQLLLSVEILQRSVAVQIGAANVEPLSEPEYCRSMGDSTRDLRLEA